MKKKVKKKNFTLIEILFVILIFIILMGIAWTASGKVMRASKIQQTKAELITIDGALEMSHGRYSKYPDVIASVSIGNKTYHDCIPADLTDGVSQYIDYEKSNITILEGVICDPYGIPYKYILGGYNALNRSYDVGFKIYSYGFDGIFGNEDDIHFN